MPDEDNLREVWSDDQLDSALAELNSTVPTDTRLLETTRVELMAAAGGPVTMGEPMTETRKRSGRHWLASAAAVAAIVAGVLVAQTMSFGGNPPVASAAAADLRAAADRVGATDPPIGPGQYRYVSMHAWGLRTATVGDKSYSHLAEELTERWVPLRYEDEWMQRRQPTGKRTWIVGTEAESIATGVLVDHPDMFEGERRAPCGDFYAADENKQPCADAGYWAKPTPEFLAGIPRDPQALFDRLRRDTEGRGKGPDQEMLVYAADFLRSGIVPADLRAAMYRALALLPGLEVTDRTTNLDGKAGMAFGLSDGETRQEIIVDVATGKFIGERRTTLVAQDPIPAGTVSSSSVDTVVVDGIGIKPAG